MRPGTLIFLNRIFMIEDLDAQGWGGEDTAACDSTSLPQHGKASGDYVGPDRAIPPQPVRHLWNGEEGDWRVDTSHCGAFERYPSRP